jgi:hypothetical protein
MNEDNYTGSACKMPAHNLYYATVIWEDAYTDKERKDSVLVQATNYSEAFCKIEREFPNIIEANIRISSYDISLGVFFLPENINNYVLSQLEEANNY